MDLLNIKCVPCEGGVPPLSIEEVLNYLKEVPEWSVDSSNKKISREFKFQDFKEAMSFVNKIADLAESEGHHPDISIFYNKVNLTLWTHAANGLTENDFIVAAKINVLT